MQYFGECGTRVDRTFDTACSTTVNVSVSFGGTSWPISPDDMNLGTVGDNLCLGGIFDLGLGSDISSGGGNPSWVVGDTFLVCLNHDHDSLPRS